MLKNQSKLLFATSYKYKGTFWDVLLCVVPLSSECSGCPVASELAGNRAVTFTFSPGEYNV